MIKQTTTTLSEQPQTQGMQKKRVAAQTVSQHWTEDSDVLFR